MGLFLKTPYQQKETLGIQNNQAQWGHLKIYIASSWRNQTLVLAVTDQLRKEGHQVYCFCEEGKEAWERLMEVWISTPKAEEIFERNLAALIDSDLVVYVGPAGTDAWAELGLAFGHAIPIVGLRMPGERAGLMQKILTWTECLEDLFVLIGQKELKANQEMKEKALRKAVQLMRDGGPNTLDCGLKDLPN